MNEEELNSITPRSTTSIETAQSSESIERPSSSFVEPIKTSSNVQDEEGEDDSSTTNASQLPEIEDDIEPSRSNRRSPYHLFGVFFFLASIVAAIILVLVTTLIGPTEPSATESASASEAANRRLGFIFGAFFSAFLGFLFLCLCSTYYLGASTSWEIPKFTGIRFSFTNFVILSGLLVEFVQICSFSFNRTQLFSGFNLSYINYIAIPAGQNSPTFFIIYWVFFALAFTPYLFILIIRVLVYVYTLRKGEALAVEIVEKSQGKIYSVLWFLVNTLYFPVIGTMIAGTDCTYREEVTLDADVSIICFEGSHIAILISTMIALIIYYPAASFAQAQTQSISDIKFKPRIVFIMLQGKFLLVSLSTFFTHTFSVYYSDVLFVDIVLLVLNIVGQPCLVRWVNRLRTFLFSMSLWATICSGVIGTWILNDQYSKIPVILLLIVWGIMVVSFPVGFFIRDKFFPPPKEEDDDV